MCRNLSFPVLPQKLRQKIFSESTAKQEDSRLEISRLLRRIGDLEHMTAKLYEDKVSGIINNDTFAVLIQKKYSCNRRFRQRQDPVLCETVAHAMYVKGFSNVVYRH